jgi:translation initiation factor IF-3
LIIAAKLRVNTEIRAKEVRVIGPEGEQIGILPVRDALRKAAEEYSLDLVEVAPTAAPPVCRIMDYGKFKYEQSKKEHATKQHQKGTQVKEVKFRPYTDKHDLDFKTRHIREFLSHGNKVKVTVMFRGREMAYQEMGRNLLKQVAQELQEIGQFEYPPKMEGHNMIMILLPKSAKEPGKPAADKG